LVTKNDQVTGHVEVGGRIYRIEPLNGQMHRVVEVDLNAMPTDAPHLIPPRAPRDSHNEIHNYATSTEATTTAPVDLLVLYTGRANNAPGDILSDINLAVKLTNQAFSNSGIRTRVRLVGTMLVVGYDEAAYSYAATLYNLTNMAGGGATTIGRNAFRGGRLRRDQLRADLVALVREGGPYCGQAWVIEQPSTSTSAYGYAQLSRACIPDFVMAHELGHTMGLLHDRYVEASAPAAKYNFGYVNVSNRVRDVMSYSNLCAARRVLCTRVNRFSNPRITVAGLPFGIRAGVAGAADASRRLNETYPYVVRFR
jgi:hypothetical protein